MVRQLVLKCFQMTTTAYNPARTPKRRNRGFGSIGAFRARDMVRTGVHPETLRRMLQRGEIQRFGPGRYRMVSAPRSAHTDVALAAAGVPRSIISLLSALRFHGIGTQAPAEVWLAVPRGARVPRLDYPPLNIVRISPQFFDLGVQEHEIEGQAVRICGIERTIADCFRFRNKIGLDVALEALKATWRDRRLDLNRLHKIAERLRVGKVMRPYLEAIVL